MSAIAFYAALKFWLPLVTLLGIFYKLGTRFISRITVWADTLLNNHLNHIQVATEDTALSMKTLAETSVGLLREIHNDGLLAATAVAQVRTDHREYQQTDAELQMRIISTLEVLKDRLS